MTGLPTVLVVDGDPAFLKFATQALGDEFDVRTAGDTAGALRVLETEWVQLLFCDPATSSGVNLGPVGGDSLTGGPLCGGADLLAAAQERWPDVLRVAVSAPAAGPDDLITADAGLYHHLYKPCHPDQLLLTARNAVHLFAVQRDHDRLALELRLARSAVDQRLVCKRDRAQGPFQFDSLIRTASSPLNDTCRQAAKAAAFDIPVLIQGETGTGKELMARAIHYASQRAAQPFFAVNCGAIPDDLLESELFGHKKGAFTGAFVTRRGLLDQADGGTMLLDEIGDISPAFQVKLLRFLQEGEIRPIGSNESRRVNVRILAASHRVLEEEVRAGRFREDLYFRLSAMVLALPPLRSRPDDIRLLAGQILDTLTVTHDKPVRGFTMEALACLQAHDWPGNVRELQNEILRMLVLADDDVLSADLLSPRVLHSAAARVSGAAPAPDGTAPPTWPSDTPPIGGLPESGDLKTRVESVEAHILMETIVRCRWNKSRTAKELGLSRVGLRAKLERYGIAPGAGRRDLQ